MYFLLTAVTLATSAPQPATDTVRYAVFTLERSGGRTLMTEGAREYSADADIRISNAGPQRSRALLLFEPYELQVRFTKGPRINGLALAIKKRKSVLDSSFNWFERRAANIFVSTRAGTTARVRVLVGTSEGLAEPMALGFLDDVALHYDEHGDGRTSHEFVILKGSILRIHDAP